ncbi:MAG: ATP-binding protein [Methylococcaceae bacterium]
MKQIKIRQKMALIVVSGTLLSAALGSVLIYQFFQHNLLTSESVKLQKITAKFTAVASERFEESQSKLANLAQLLESELAKPIKKGEIKTFYQTMERNPDGVWRNRKPNFNGKLESGIFLPPNSSENDLQKIRHLRIKHTMDSFGAAASKRFENIWYLSPHRSEIIFDKNYPEFAFEQKADNDYTQTPWLTYANPELNPQKILRFTPPLFDPVPKVWMVSAIYPIYVNNEWIGSLGEDMPLTNVLKFMFESEQMYKDTEHFLVDTQGNFVLAGAWQKELEASPEGFKPNLEQEKSFAALLKIPLTHEPQLLTDDLQLHNRRYIVIGMTLEPLNWHYYLLAPVDEIMASTRELFLNLFEMVILLGGLNGIFMFTITGRTITNRIKIITDAINSYSENQNYRIASKMSGNDEISRVGRAFDQMANEISDNITELNKRTEQLQSVFDVSPSGYVLVNNQNKILLVNKSASLIAGLSVSDLLNMTKEEFLTNLSNQATEPFISLNGTSQPLRIELIRPRRTVLLFGRREIIFTNGDLLGKLYFFHDITKEEESNQIKSEFLMSAAHELRTPLTTIHGYSELLSSGMIPADMQPEIIGMIYQQSTWLITMINELLDLSRIEERAGADFVIESCPLADLIQQTIADFAIPEGRDAIIYVPFESEISLNVDKNKFKQALLNIIDNAYKYSPNGGAVSINVNYDAVPHFVEIETKDCGLGLTDDEIAHVFERFFRVDKSGNVPGVGLGLSLSKEIINLFNGKIYITSVPNQGSSVFVRFNLD